MPPLLSIEGLDVRYDSPRGAVRAVDGLDLVLEAGETRCGPGTLIVDRGVIHGWRNDGPATAVYASVTLPAKPVGKGRTV